MSIQSRKVTTGAVRKSEIKPLVRIGKNGITEGQLDEIMKMLKKRKIVKIKMLRSFIKGRDKKQAIQEVAERTQSRLINQTGNTFVLYKG